MDLSYTPEQEAFRKKVRAWIKANVPKREKDSSGIEYGDPKRIAALKAWQRKLYDAGYVAMGWPKEYGGQDADVVQQTIVNEELLLARAPGLVGMMGIQMVGPTLIQFGTDEQKQRYLPKILTAEEIWCQGYSEPGSGSDLASLKTRAELVGDEFIVNGQKVWTSNAQFADWMFCLVRTDPDAPKHRGISYLLIDMQSPGITVRPLIQMTGDPGFNEVFFEDRARAAPESGRRAEPRLAGGQRHAGARAQHARLDDAHAADVQRPAAPGAEPPALRPPGVGGSGHPPTARRPDDPRRSDEVPRLPSAHRHHQEASARHRRVGEQAGVDRAEPRHRRAGAWRSWARTARWRARSRHVIDRGSWPIEFMFTLGLIIGGGTSQIQKNIISERGLGMPRQ